MAPSVAFRAFDGKLLVNLSYEKYEKHEDPPLMMKPNIFRGGLVSEFYPLPASFNYSSTNDYRDVFTENSIGTVDWAISRNWNFRATFAKTDSEVSLLSTGQAGTGLIGDVPASGNLPAIAAINAMQRRVRFNFDESVIRDQNYEMVGKFDVGPAKVRVLAGYLNGKADGGGRQVTLPGNLQPRAWDLSSPATWDRSGLFSPSQMFGGGSTFFGRQKAWWVGAGVTVLDDRLIGLAGYRESRITTGAGKNTGKPMQLGLLYKGPGGINPYVAYTESFQPVFALLRRDGVPTVQAEPTYGEGMEAGVKIDALEGRFSSTFTVFQTTNTNIIQNIVKFVNSQTVFDDVQTGEQEAQGVELDFVWTPQRNLQLYASYAYTDASISKNPQNPAFEGRRFQGVARNQIGLWTRYSFTDGFMKGGYVAGGGNYLGGQLQRVENQSMEFAPYWLLDLAIGYPLKISNQRFDLELSVKNITDEDYAPSNNSRGYPRRATLSVTTKF